MGKVKELYIQYLEDRFQEDAEVMEYMQQQDVEEQIAWMQWLEEKHQDEDEIPE